jgi:pimeloyl-ACP methyl ester carboxylesterase
MSGSALEPTRSGYATYSGHRVYWETYGPDDHPTIVLLHHGLGSIRSWHRQVPAFLERGWRVLGYDRWGYGRSDPRQEFELGFLHSEAEECYHLLHDLGVGRACLVGHSDGGSIGILVAAAHPERVQRLVLVAAHIYVEAEVVSGMEMIKRSAGSHAFLRSLEHEHGQRAQQLVEAWLTGWMRPENLEFNLRGFLPNVRCPTLVIQGEQDEHATPQHARDIASLVPQAALWLIPAAHHMPTHEVPDILNARVLEFLEPVREGIANSGEPRQS